MSKAFVFTCQKQFERPKNKAKMIFACQKKCKWKKNVNEMKKQSLQKTNGL